MGSRSGSNGDTSGLLGMNSGVLGSSPPKSENEYGDAGGLPKKSGSGDAGGVPFGADVGGRGIGVLVDGSWGDGVRGDSMAWARSVVLDLVEHTATPKMVRNQQSKMSWIAVSQTGQVNLEQQDSQGLKENS